MLILLGCSSPSTSGGPYSSQPKTSNKSGSATSPTAGTVKEAEPTTTQEKTESTRKTDLALISASSRGDTQAVERLLEQGADVHARDDSGGTTPLIAAAYRNHVETARILIEAGADVNVKDETQQSAYLISTSEIGDDPRLLKLTLANGADVRSLDSYNGTGLIRAAERGYVQIVQELLETDVDVDHVNNLGWTALLEAIILGDCGPSHTEVVRMQVEAGADVNLADGNGITPLQHARQQNCTGIAEILEGAGAV
ncbi:MAG: ankyrin repeat domain-containing protein [Rubrobacteraceae bacterium]